MQQPDLLKTLSPKLQQTCGSHGCLFTKRIKHETAGGRKKCSNWSALSIFPLRSSTPFSVVIKITISVKFKIMINKEWYFWQEKGLPPGRRRRQTIALRTYTAEWRMVLSPSGESTPRRTDWGASVVMWLENGAAEEHNAMSPWSVRWYWNRFEYSMNG